MGEPVRIVDLARDLISLSGLEVGRDIDIAFTGLRPGEKLYEELFVDGEDYQRTAHQKIFIASNASRLSPNGLEQSIDELIAAATCNDETAIRRGLQALISESRSPEENGRAALADLPAIGPAKPQPAVSSPAPSIRPRTSTG
jgi:FlaA1/EpsC-like NDP-sugar epimerase